MRSDTPAPRNEDYKFAAEGHDVHETLNEKEKKKTSVLLMYPMKIHYPVGTKYFWQSKNNGSADQNIKQIVFKNVDHHVQNQN